jgi:tRNA/rRNA methyltransferase
MRPPSRFQRRPGPNADPLTRRDETFAFTTENGWSAPDWFRRIVVVLFETNDAVNIGGVVRAMANTGFTRLRLVNPAYFESWDVIGVAHYTQHIIETATRHSTLEDALADTCLVAGLSGKHHRAQRNAARLDEAAKQLAASARAGYPVALLLGREDIGLPNEALDRCHLVAHIPTNPAYPSLNLAQATLLALYTLFQQAGGTDQFLRPPRRTAPPASAALLEDLFADLERSLEAVEFFKTRSRPSIMRSLRAALYRAHLDVREASLLRAVAIEVRRYLHRREIRDDVGPLGPAERRP